MFNFNKMANYIDALSTEQLHKDIQSVITKRKELPEMVKQQEEKRYKVLLPNKKIKQTRTGRAEQIQNQGKTYINYYRCWAVAIKRKPFIPKCSSASLIENASMR